MATESKATAGLEIEMVGVTEKSKVKAGMEAETAVGMESGADMEVGRDSKSTVDMSGNIGVVAGAEVGTGSAMANVRVEMGSMVVGTDTGDDVVVVVGARVGKIVETIPSVCAAPSESSVLANAQLGIVGMATEMAE